MSNEKYIIASWHANAGNWIDIIRDEGIESRKLVTNKAILDAVLESRPETLLDVGCGEGWLAKILYARGIVVSGIDVVDTLIQNVRETVPGNFVIGSYEGLAAGKFFNGEKFDAIVINFALIGKDSTEDLLAALPQYLNPSGNLFIQTLHPHARKGINDYNSGWKKGSWDGLGDQFTHSYEWYFRTLENWLALLSDSGFSSIETKETFHPVTQAPLSVIFQCGTGVK